MTFVYCADRHARKAHRGANTTGAQKVQGFKKSAQDTISEMERIGSGLSVEDAALFARLDELEAVEHKREELSYQEEDEEHEKPTRTVNKEDEVHWKKRDEFKGKTEKETVIIGKHVQWKDKCVDSDDEQEEDMCRTIPVTFTPAPADLKVSKL